MPLTTARNLDHFIDRGLHRFAVGWRLTLRDGTQFLFTDHDSLLFIAGQWYEPTGGFDATAREKNEGLEDENFAIRGVITSDKITTEDLQAGRYDAAKVEEFIVDWMYPHAGILQSTEFILHPSEFTKYTWKADLEGTTTQLKAKIGQRFDRPCPVELGSARCGLDLGPYTYEDVRVTQVDTDQLIFRAETDIPGGLGDNYFQLGKLIWTTGLNALLEMECRSYTDTGRIFTLMLETPYSIAVDDRLTIMAGCDGRKATCRDTYSNLINHQGFYLVPGRDAVLKTPAVFS